MSKITYEIRTIVKVGDRVVGSIKEEKKDGNIVGYSFYVLGSLHGGKVHPTLAECKTELET